jgi:hypothetical protein
MRKRLLIFTGIAVVFAIGFLLGSRLMPVKGADIPGSGFAAVPGEVGGQDYTGPYEVVADWPKPLTSLPGHEKWTWGAGQSIFAQNANRVFLAQRGELPAMKRPENTPIPQFGPSLSFPVNEVPFRNASQGPVASLPGGFGGGGETVPFILGTEQVAHKDWKGKVNVDARWEHPILVVDGRGNVLPETENWKQWNLKFSYPHYVTINPYDPEKHIWIVEAARHAVYKFSNDGKKLELTLGVVNAPGSDDKHFDRPTFIAWLPDSTMFVADGYANTRVVKFDKDGKFLMQWGQKGSGGLAEGGGQKPPDTRPGYFNTVHGIAVDPVKREVFVNDRANRRLQVFDENGKFLRQWSYGPIASMYMLYMPADHSRIWGSDARTSKIISWDLQGHLLYAWGILGDFPGGIFGTHTINVDEEGNLYTAEVSNGKFQKFRPRKGANPEFLVGKPLRVAWKN